MMRLVRPIFVLAALCMAFFGGLCARRIVRNRRNSRRLRKLLLRIGMTWGTGLVAMAEDWPEDKYDYKLAPTTRTFQEVILHVAGSNYDMLNKMAKSKLGDGRNDPAVADYKTKAATVAFLKKSIEDGAAVAKKQGDAGVVKLLEYWDGYTEHMGEHYGLLVAYYRASGGVPPESRPKK